jgi:hypothetical protein
LAPLRLEPQPVGRRLRGDGAEYGLDLDHRWPDGDLRRADHSAGSSCRALRTNLGPQVYRAGVAVGAPAAITFNQQGGGNLQDVIEELCQKANMCPNLRRTAAAVRYIDIEYPYERADKTGTVVLTRRRGTGSDFEMNVQYTLTTVARLAGAGSGAAQTPAWATTNVPQYGVHENQLTLPGVGAASAVQDATAMIRASTPLSSYKITPRDTTNVQ